MSKGKGPSSPRFDGTGHNCGNDGYKASDCWSNVSSLRNTKGKGKSKDQGGKNCKDQKGNGNQAGSLDDAGQMQESESETGSLGLGAFDSSESRAVQFLVPKGQRICGLNKYKESGYVKFNLDTRAAVDGISSGYV